MALTDWLADVKLRLGMRRRPKLRGRLRDLSSTPAMVQMLEPRRLLSVNAVNDTFTVANSGPAPMPVQLNVLANDTSTPAGQSISLTSVMPAMGGTVSIVHAGAGQQDYLQYMPFMGYAGPDTFTYTEQAADGSVGTAMVNLTVTGVEAPTFAQSNYNFGPINTTTPGVIGTVSATGAGLTYSIVSNPTLPPAAFSINSTGQISYTGAGWPPGMTSVSFQVQAQNSPTSFATTNVTITAANQTPTFAQANYNFGPINPTMPGVIGAVSATGTGLTYSIVPNPMLPPAAFSINSTG
jgi:hypothetical protein